MKAITAVCATGASVPAIVNGRVSRPRNNNNNSNNQSNNNGENAEIKMYLSKLKDLVPFMPKNRKLSKLEIIQHVIDYICDLQSELETSPAVSNFDAAAVLNELQQSQQDDSSRITNQNINNSNNNNSLPTSQQHQQHQQIRQPLADRSSPNMILSSSSSSSSSFHASEQISSVAGHFNLNHQSSSHSHTTPEEGHSRC